MGLRVGVVTGNHEPNSGGAWTFIETLAAAVKTAECSHAFVFLDDLLQSDGLEERWARPASVSNHPKRDQVTTVPPSWQVSAR